MNLFLLWFKSVLLQNDFRLKVSLTQCSYFNVFFVTSRNSNEHCIQISSSDVLHYTSKKAEHLYSALHGIQTTLKRSGMDHTAFNLLRTPCQLLPRKRSPDGASTECGGGHLTAGHSVLTCRRRLQS